MITTLFLAAALSAHPVPDQTVSMTIERAELETTEGRAAVYGRAKRLAKRTCRVGVTTGATHSLKTACAAEMLDELVAGIGDYRVTALHEGGGAAFAARP